MFCAFDTRGPCVELLLGDPCTNMSCLNGGCCYGFSYQSHVSVAYAVCICSQGYDGQWCEKSELTAVEMTTSIAIFSRQNPRLLLSNLIAVSMNSSYFLTIDVIAVIK